MAGMSQGQLADRAGLSRGYILSIEAGRKNVTLGTVVRIARVFGVEAIDLLISY